MVRGIVLVTLSPVAFQLALPLAPLLGIKLAKWVMTIAAMVFAAAGSSRVVLGAFEYSEAKRALQAELPSARLLPPNSEER